MTPTVKQVIVQEALRNPNIPRKALAVQLADLLARMGEIVPQEETILKLISKTRNSNKLSEDAHWTLGANWKSGIPSEAIPDLLKISKLRKAMNRSFTIREAKWVAQLRTLVSEINNLSNWANLYAYHELACEKINEPFDTSNLEAALTMGGWEWATARCMRKVNQIPQTKDEYYVRAVPPQENDDSSEFFARDIEASVRPYWAQLRDDPAGINNEAVGLFERLRDTDVSTLGFSKEALWVYGCWLEYLSQGPDWESLPQLHRLQIVERLREWIQNNKWNKIAEWSWVLTSRDRFIDSDSDFFIHHMKESELYPLELMEEVGYEEYFLIEGMERYADELVDEEPDIAEYWEE